MATGGVLGNGTKVGFSISSPVTFTRVGQLINVDEFLQLVPDDVDTTVHSTSNIRTSISGMIEPPEFTMTLLADFDQATTTSHETLRQYQGGSGYAATQGVVIWFGVEIPVNKAQSSFRRIEFQAYVKTYGPSLPIDDVQKVEITVRFSGTGIAWYNAGASVIT